MVNSGCKEANKKITIFFVPYFKLKVKTAVFLKSVAAVDVEH
jgi:hypothetical protein